MQTIRVEKSGTTTTVILNRPEVRNAFHPTMIQELTEVFSKTIPADKNCRVVVLRGEGKSFCSGADLGWMKSMVDYDLKENTQDSEKLFAMFAAIRSCAVPVVGRIHGHAMGGAVGLTAVCDVAAAVTDTQFCFTEVKLGLVPAVISPFVLEKMNAGWARRWMLTGDVFSAEHARLAGLVHFVGSETEVDEFVSGVVKSFNEGGPEAVQATKKLAQAVSVTGDWQQKDALTTKVIAERRVSAEGQEGLRGFLEKRTPSWKKK